MKNTRTKGHQMKTVSPRQGPPIKQPRTPVLKRLGHLSPILDDVRKILAKCQMPAQTLEISLSKGKDGKPKFDSTLQPITPQPISDTDLGLILEVANCPTVLRHTEKAIQWAKLFADNYGMMIDALPKINNRLAVMFRSPQQKIVWHYLLCNDLGRFYRKFNDNFSARLFDETAEELACELSETLGETITAKHVEKARGRVKAMCLIPLNSKRK
jgi:hypothetical protein